MRPATFALVVLTLLAAGGAGRADAGEDGQMLYVLHCSGCHGRQGAAATVGRIPALAGNIGYFMETADARIFLPQAPGVMNSGLGDADVATLMNWLVPTLARGSLSEPFKPYTAEEIARSRANRPADFFATRRKVAAELKGRGIELPGY